DVNADAAANRTDVSVRPWIETPQAKKIMRAAIEAFGDASAAGATLDALSGELATEKTGPEIADFVESETLPHLGRLLARRNISAAFRERLRIFSDELQGSLGALRGETGAPALRRVFRAKAVAGRTDELDPVIHGTEQHPGGL